MCDKVRFFLTFKLYEKGGALDIPTEIGWIAYMLDFLREGVFPTKQTLKIFNE